MPDTVTPHPTLYAVWAPSPHVEAQGEPRRIALFETREAAEEGVDLLGPDCWIVDPARVKHHHHLPEWNTADLVLIHDAECDTHDDHHQRFSVSPDVCVDEDCEAKRWDVKW